MSTLRAAVERRSGTLLAWLSLRPRLLLPGVVLVLFLLAALLPPPLSTLCLLPVLLLAAWLTYLSWPVLDGRARVLRTVVLVLLVGLVALDVR